MISNKLAVVVPVYNSRFSDDDKISLHHLEKYLRKYPKIFIVPEKLGKKIKRKNYYVKSFPDKYFESVKSYSELLLTKEFYNNFSQYKYILIYQLDALVFNSSIDNFMNANIDYVGSPLFNTIIGFLSRDRASLNYGCNGGLSLRKVESFIKVIEIAENEAEHISTNNAFGKANFAKAVLSGKSMGKWLGLKPESYPFNEDGFWSFEATKYYPNFKVASRELALKFAFERFPRKCFKLNSGKIPFGCHAWKKYDPEFWSPYLLTSRS